MLCGRTALHISRSSWKWLIHISIITHDVVLFWLQQKSSNGRGTYLQLA